MYHNTDGGYDHSVAGKSKHPEFGNQPTTTHQIGGIGDGAQQHQESSQYNLIARHVQLIPKGDELPNVGYENGYELHLGNPFPENQPSQKYDNGRIHKEYDSF